MKLNKLTLLSVGVTGLGLMACGPGTKDGDPKPVDSTTVRQAIVGNTKAIAADFSRTSKFLEVSSLLQRGVGMVAPQDVTVCTGTPDGGPETCDTTPAPADESIDLDINDATDELLAELERRVLADANVEASEEFAVTYLVRGDLWCAQDGAPLDPECVAEVDAAEIRLVVTSPANGDVDVDVLIGPNRANPLSLQVHANLLAVEADLGGIKDSAEHVAGIVGGDVELPATFEGRVRVEVSAPSDHEFGGSISVLQAVKVADGEFTFSVGQSLPLYSVMLDSNAKTLLGEAGVGAVDGSFLASSYTYDSATDVETETINQMGFHLAGLTGKTLLDVANEVVTLTGMGLGPNTSTLSVDGSQVAALDLNPADGRTINATITADADDAVRVVVDPKLDLTLALQFMNAMDAVEGDDWMLDEVFNITFDGAAAPTLLLAEDRLEVVDGTLTMSMQNAGISRTISAGQCMLDPVGDAPTPVDPTNPDSDPLPVEETATNPLEDVVVGACQ